MVNFNERFRQIIFFLLITSIGLLILLQIRFLIPGILGAVTLYILNRKLYFRFVYEKKWNRFFTTFLFVIINAIILLIPFGILFSALAPKINDLFSNSGELYVGIKEIIKEISGRTGIDLSSNENLQNIPGLLSKILPQIVGTASSALLNTVIAFFLLFFMLYHANRMEQTLVHYIPLKKENIHHITAETKSIVTSYAVGIPVLAISQGIAAFIGYSIFGIKDALLWAFATCVCSVLPFIGSAIIFLPLIVYLFAFHHTGAAVGLTLYSLIVIVNIDNILRLVLLKAFADIHPLITLFGVITGLRLFGFIGLIFGPLLVSYFLLLIKIYTAEFAIQEDSRLNM
jgi:predicted PurR-regulated permease PerM